ncbi:MAG: hypothetical protein ACRCSO_09050 [Sphingomonas sp.]
MKLPVILSALAFAAVPVAMPTAALAQQRTVVTEHRVVHTEERHDVRGDDDHGARRHVRRVCKVRWQGHRHVRYCRTVRW